MPPFPHTVLSSLWSAQLVPALPGIIILTPSFQALLPSSSEADPIYVHAKLPSYLPTQQTLCPCLVCPTLWQGSRNLKLCKSFRIKYGFKLGNNFTPWKGVGRGKIHEQTVIQAVNQHSSPREQWNLHKDNALIRKIGYCSSGAHVTSSARFLQKYSPACFTPWLCVKASQCDLPWNPVDAASHSRRDLFHELPVLLLCLQQKAHNAYKCVNFSETSPKGEEQTVLFSPR